MSIPHRVRGVRVLKAVSSPVRLQILNLLFDGDALTYTELMGNLKMNPGREAGRFAYHLKSLLKADLVETDPDSKKYCLTDLGKMVLDVADRVEKKALKPKTLLVRESRLGLEEFDANRIADSLVKEAKMPVDLAQRVSKEAEKRLLKSKTKYLTSPLVREMVNALLIEKGFEEYRHRLTRLGLPVYEVGTLVNDRAETGSGAASVMESAGEAVMREYMLVSVFPRDVADAHVAGSLHIDSLGSWILKPDEVFHDMRCFLQHGLNLSQKQHSVQKPPRDFPSALNMILNVLLNSKPEVNKAQTVEYFNVFLAPFLDKSEPAAVKEALLNFILNVSQLVDTSLCLELTVPDFLARVPAVGANGKSYADFGEEAQLLVSSVLDVISSISEEKPVLNPEIIVKIGKRIFEDERARALLLKSHNLSLKGCSVFFAGSVKETRNQQVFSGSGYRLTTNPKGDWETDALRNACIGNVSVNLPKLAYESENDKRKFFALLDEQLHLAAEALEIKCSALAHNGNGLLPFLAQQLNGDRYLRLENSSMVISLLGLNEAVWALSGKKPFENEEASQLTDEIIGHITEYTEKASMKRQKRFLPAFLPNVEASSRLAQLDVDRYGIGRVKVMGTRENPHYSSLSATPVKQGKIPQQFSAANQKLRTLQVGGGFSVLELGDAEFGPDDLTRVTKEAVDAGMEFFTYDRKFTFCSSCRKSIVGLLHKCPACGGTGTLVYFDRFPEY